MPAEVLTPADIYANLGTEGFKILHFSMIFCLYEPWLLYGC